MHCLEGWFNTDIYPNCDKCFFLDARKAFPFKDSTFDCIYTEHMIEHLPYDQGLSMLSECYRILKHGGRLRIVTPDLEVLIGLYRPEKTGLQQRYIQYVVDAFLPNVCYYNECFVINYVFKSWGHQFIYDRVTLKNSLEGVGFRHISYHSVGESNDFELRDVESHAKTEKHVDHNVVQFESMAVEARRL